MKKSLALIAVCLAVVLLLAGCAGKQAEKGSVPGQTKDTAEPTKIEEGEAEETEDKAADAEAADTPEAVEAGEAEETEGKAADAEASDPAEAGKAGNTAAGAETAGAGTSEAAAIPEETGSGSPVVYFSSDISAEGLVNIYDALGWTPAGKTAVKISTGEPPASNYLRPELIEDLVKKVDGTIVECNTAYGGSRSSSAMHRQVAAQSKMSGSGFLLRAARYMSTAPGQGPAAVS